MPKSIIEWISYFATLTLFVVLIDAAIIGAIIGLFHMFRLFS